MYIWWVLIMNILHINLYIKLHYKARFLIKYGLRMDKSNVQIIMIEKYPSVFVFFVVVF